MGLLDGKVVVVTGAGRGIGRAIASAVAASGANVVVNDFGVTMDGREPSSEVADAVANEIVGAGGSAVASYETVATMDGGQAIIQSGLDAWGRIDGVVCCAGIVRHRPFLEMSEAEWDGVIETNLTGTFTVFRAAADVMAEQGSGSLVAISSGFVLGDPMRANYRAAKAGVVALMMSVAIAGDVDGYRANAIAPIANTRMTQAADIDAPPPEDVAPLAVYLLSDLAQRVTGRVLSISGRRLAAWSAPTEVNAQFTEGRWTPEALDVAISSFDASSTSATVDAGVHRELGKSSNNRAWDLLGQDSRTEADDREMVHAAHASLYHWLQCGTAANEQRGEWLVSHVYAELGDGSAALRHAQRCWDITEQESLDGFDRAYACEAMFRAHAALGDEAASKDWHARAEGAAAAITDSEDRELFLADLEA